MDTQNPTNPLFLWKENVRCRYCGNDYLPRNEYDLSVLTIFRDKSYNQNYVTTCNSCKKCTVTPKDSVPHAVWDAFWERTDAADSYFLAAEDCSCGVHLTERLATVDNARVFTYSGVYYYIKCPVCNKAGDAGNGSGIPSDIRKGIKEPSSCCCIL